MLLFRCIPWSWLLHISVSLPGQLRTCISELLWWRIRPLVCFSSHGLWKGFMIWGIWHYFCRIFTWKENSKGFWQILNCKMNHNIAIRSKLSQEVFIAVPLRVRKTETSLWFSCEWNQRVLIKANPSALKVIFTQFGCCCWLSCVSSLGPAVVLGGAETVSVVYAEILIM